MPDDPRRASDAASAHVRSVSGFASPLKLTYSKESMFTAYGEYTIGVRMISLRILFVILTIFAALLVTILSAQPSYAVTTVPAKMNFQGRLTNSSGNIMANGTYNMKLRLFSAASGGSSLWNEDRLVSASNGITVTNGLFSLRMGDVTSIPTSLFASGNLYLEVELPTPATATSASPVWTEGAMTPRNVIATSAYAFNTETLDGLDSAAFAQIGGNNTFTGTNIFTPTSNGTATFSIQDSSGVSLLTADSTNDRLYIGQTTADSNATFLAVDSYNQAADPSGGFNGAIYYNSSTNRLRCYEAGAWTDCIASGYTIHVQALTSTPTDAQTVYFGTLPKAPVTAAGTSKVYIRRDGTIKAAQIYVYSGTAGSNQAWSLYIRKNYTTDTLISTLSVNTNERVFSNTGLSIPVAAGDYVEIKGVQPTWTTNPATTIYGGYIYVE